MSSSSSSSLLSSSSSSSSSSTTSTTTTISTTSSRPLAFLTALLLIFMFPLSCRSDLTPSLAPNTTTGIYAKVSLYLNSIDCSTTPLIGTGAATDDAIGNKCLLDLPSAFVAAVFSGPGGGATSCNNELFVCNSQASSVFASAACVTCKQGGGGPVASVRVECSKSTFSPPPTISANTTQLPNNPTSICTFQSTTVTPSSHATKVSFKTYTNSFCSSSSSCVCKCCMGSICVSSFLPDFISTSCTSSTCSTMHPSQCPVAGVAGVNTPFPYPASVNVPVVYTNVAVGACAATDDGYVRVVCSGSTFTYYKYFSNYCFGTPATFYVASGQSTNCSLINLNGNTGGGKGSIQFDNPCPANYPVDDSIHMENASAATSISIGLIGLIWMTVLVIAEM